MTRITLRPLARDMQLETVQGFILCAHWMPFDLSVNKERYRSRFWEGSAWQSLGLAIRWANFLVLEKTAVQGFQEAGTATKDDARRYRTILYLTESDH